MKASGSYGKLIRSDHHEFKPINLISKIEFRPSLYVDLFSYIG